MTAPDEPLHGAQLCASVAELVAACQVPLTPALHPHLCMIESLTTLMVLQILIVCLPDEAASLEVILEQALPHSQAGQLFIDTSTVSQQLSLR